MADCNETIIQSYIQQYYDVVKAYAELVEAIESKQSAISVCCESKNERLERIIAKLDKLIALKEICCALTTYYLNIIIPILERKVICICEEGGITTTTTTIEPTTTTTTVLDCTLTGSVFCYSPLTTTTTTSDCSLSGTVICYPPVTTTTTTGVPTTTTTTVTPPTTTTTTCLDCTTTTTTTCLECTTTTTIEQTTTTTTTSEPTTTTTTTVDCSLSGTIVCYPSLTTTTTTTDCSLSGTIICYAPPTTTTTTNLPTTTTTTVVQITTTTTTGIPGSTTTTTTSPDIEYIIIKLECVTTTTTTHIHPVTTTTTVIGTTTTTIIPPITTTTTTKGTTWIPVYFSCGEEPTTTTTTIPLITTTTTTICTRPLIHEQEAFIYAWGLNEVPPVVHTFLNGTEVQACIEFHNFKAEDQDDVTRNFYPGEYVLFIYGQTVYEGYDETDCEVIPDGVYWVNPLLLPRDPTAQEIHDLACVYIVTIFEGKIYKISDPCCIPTTTTTSTTIAVCALSGSVVCYAPPTTTTTTIILTTTTSTTVLVTTTTTTADCSLNGTVICYLPPTTTTTTAIPTTTTTTEEPPTTTTTTSDCSLGGTVVCYEPPTTTTTTETPTTTTTTEEPPTTTTTTCLDCTTTTTTTCLECTTTTTEEPITTTTTTSEPTTTTTTTTDCSLTGIIVCYAVTTTTTTGLPTTTTTTIAQTTTTTTTTDCTLTGTVICYAPPTTTTTINCTLTGTIVCYPPTTTTTTTIPQTTTTTTTINQPPTCYPSSITINRTYCLYPESLVASLFLYTDPEFNAINAIKITSLPIVGELYYNGIPVLINQVIPVLQPGTYFGHPLVYYCDDTVLSGYVTTFQFQVRTSNSSTFSDACIFTINVSTCPGITTTTTTCDLIVIIITPTTTTTTIIIPTTTTTTADCLLTGTIICYEPPTTTTTEEPITTTTTTADCSLSGSVVCYEPTTTTTTVIPTTTTTTGIPTTTTTTCYVGCVELGFLYNWYAQDNALKLSSSDDWVFSQLHSYFDAEECKETGTAHWDSPNTATNIQRLNLRGCGIRSGISGGFSGINIYWFERNDPTGDHYFALNSSGVFTSANGDNRYRLGFSQRFMNPSTLLSDGQCGTYVGNDGKIYPTICIYTGEVYGNIEFMTCDLAETQYRDLTIIPYVSDPIDWRNLVTGARCAYDNDCSYVGYDRCEELCPGDTTTTTTSVPTTTTTTTSEPPTTTTTTADCTLSGTIVCYGLTTTTTTGDCSLSGIIVCYEATTTTTTISVPTTTTTTIIQEYLECGVQKTYYFTGIEYPHEVNVNVGSAIGQVNLIFDASGIPDRFVVLFDGLIVIDSGYYGTAGALYNPGGPFRWDWQTALSGRVDPYYGTTYPDVVNYPIDGYPLITDALGTSLSFYKNSATANVVVRVYSPLSSVSQWWFILLCPVPTTTTTTTIPTTTTTSTTIFIEFPNIPVCVKLGLAGEQYDVCNNDPEWVYVLYGTTVESGEGVYTNYQCTNLVPSEYEFIAVTGGLVYHLDDGIVGSMLGSTCPIFSCATTTTTTLGVIYYTEEICVKLTKVGYEELADLCNESYETVYFKYNSIIVNPSLVPGTIIYSDYACNHIISSEYTYITEEVGNIFPLDFGIVGEQLDVFCQGWSCQSEKCTCVLIDYLHGRLSNDYHVPWGIYISPDGTKMFVSIIDTPLTPGTQPVIAGYDLHDPFEDAQNVTYVSKKLLLSSFFEYRSLFMNETGDKVYIINATLGCIECRSLSIEWDISSAGSSYYNFDLGSVHGNGLYFSPDGTRMYITGTFINEDQITVNHIFQYSLSVAWDLSAGVTYIQSVELSDKPLSGIWISNDGRSLYCIGTGTFSESYIHRFNMSTPWDLGYLSHVCSNLISATLGDLFGSDTSLRFYFTAPWHNKFAHYYTELHLYELSTIIQV